MILLILLNFLFVNATCAINYNSLSADEVLQKTSDKLASLKTIKYKYHQEYNYKSEAYFAESRAKSFLDFASVESPIGLRFQFDDGESQIIYNGSEKFSLNKKDKTIKVEAKPTGEGLASSSYLQFALPMWRNILPQIIADKTIPKSISETNVNDQSYYLVEFSLDKASIDSGLGKKIFPMTVDRKTIYRLTIDKNTFLPIEAYRGNNVNEDFNKATFSEITENPALPIENSWFYSTYLKDYQYAKKTEDRLIKTGETAYEMRLSKFGTNKTVSLDDYKGKIVLLEFWIFHCGYCQAAVSKLNAIQQKYKGKDFQILAVNIADSDNQLQLFNEKFRPEFPILYQGEEVAKQYGITYYPTIVLLGKDSKVIYSGLFDEEKIDELIKQNL